MRPDFVTIGAMKCGTSSLHRYLDLHPEIGMSDPKEPSFFVEAKNWSRGLEWYESIFPRDARVRGESSTNYTKHPVHTGVPERMKRVIPDARLIYLVRNPIERIRAAWVHNVAHGREGRSFLEALSPPETSSYVHPARYHTQMSQWLPHYPRDRILILGLADLSSRRRETLRRVFRFVGVDEGFDHPDFEVTHHASTQKRRYTSLGRWLAGSPRIRGRLRRHVPWLVERPIPRPQVPPDLRERLDEILEPEVRGIQELAGEDLKLDCA
ncbi:MAG: sulfotransferase family protein [Planctomycetota bacterium]|jgi:hypothetical protein